MSSQSITLKEAKKLYPAAVKQVQEEASKRLKRSRNKKKGKSIKELSWSLNASVEITGACSIEDIFNGTIEKDVAKFDALPVEDKVADEVSRTTVSLSARMPGSHGSATLSAVPQVMVDSIRAGFVSDHEEQERLSSMTDEERRAEMADLLQQLSGPGFFAV